MTQSTPPNFPQSVEHITKPLIHPFVCTHPPDLELHHMLESSKQLCTSECNQYRRAPYNLLVWRNKHHAEPRHWIGDQIYSGLLECDAKNVCRCILRWVRSSLHRAGKHLVLSFFRYLVSVQAAIRLVLMSCGPHLSPWGVHQWHCRHHHQPSHVARCFPWLWDCLDHWELERNVQICILFFLSRPINNVKCAKYELQQCTVWLVWGSCLLF